MRRIDDFECPDCGSISEHLWDVDSEGPKCECGGTKNRLIGASKMSYQGAKTFRQRVPDGFKDVLKHTERVTPTHYKESKFSAL